MKDKSKATIEQKCKEMIREFIKREYYIDEDPENRAGILYSVFDDDNEQEHDIQIIADINNRTIEFYYDDIMCDRTADVIHKYSDDEFIKQMVNLDWDGIYCRAVDEYREQEGAEQ